MADFTNFFPLIMVFILCGSAHEFCHAWSAYRLGDTTSRDLGRLTMNPFVHVDIMGTVVVPILTFMVMQLPFGWMKPVPVSPAALKRPRRDMLLVSLAGPYANLMLAFIGFLVLLFFGLHSEEGSTSVVRFWIQINLLLAYLNLLPIPPLDGSSIVDYLFRNKGWSYKNQGYLGLFLFMLLFLVGFKLLGRAVASTYSFFCGFPILAIVVLALLIGAGIAFFWMTGSKERKKKKRDHVQTGFMGLFDKALQVGGKLAEGERLSDSEQKWLNEIQAAKGDANELCSTISFQRENEFCIQCPNTQRCATRLIESMRETLKLPFQGSDSPLSE